MWLPIFAIWGCVPEITKNCPDMTNSSSTYIGITVGAAIGLAISWWIYNRQNKTSSMQDHILQRISKLEDKNRKILINLESYSKHHEELLSRIVLLNEHILALDKKIESMTEKKK